MQCVRIEMRVAYLDALISILCRVDEELHCLGTASVQFSVCLLVPMHLTCSSSLHEHLGMYFEL
jgi:hypothetical protein